MEEKEILKEDKKISDNDLIEIKNNLDQIGTILEKNIAIFDKLHKKFPDINIFKEGFKENKIAIDKKNELIMIFNNNPNKIIDFTSHSINEQKIQKSIQLIKANIKQLKTLLKNLKKI